MGYGKMKYKKGGAMKPVPKGNKGLGKLPTAVRNKMGYMMDGGEKMLMRMTYGGSSMDMSDPMVERMRMGGSTYSGKSTTEKSTKKSTTKPSTRIASAGSSKPLSYREQQIRDAKAKGITYPKK